MIQSATIWAVVAILTITLYFVMLLMVAIFPSDKKRRAAHAQCFWWSDCLTFVNPYWEIKTVGLENIDKNKAYVIVANHQSMADIMVLYQTRAQFKWVAKDALFKVPFIGWSLALAKHIKLARGDFSSIKQVYREATSWLKSGMSVLFFPEGTRSETGEMKEFQNGAFKLAVNQGVPVLPIRLDGTYNAIPKGSWLFELKAPCRIKVLPAIDTTGYGTGDFAALRDLVRKRLEEA